MVTVGSDVELPLTRKGQLVSAVGRVKGMKEAPFSLGDGATVHPDGVNVEIGHAPAYSAAEFVGNIRNALRLASKHVHPHRMIVRAASTYPNEELNTPEARTFGCNPEWSAWEFDGDRPKMVEPPSPDTNLRSCGGHIHAGYRISDIPMTVRSMDLVVGIPLLLLNNDPSSRERNKLYGGAGKFRPTSHGLEYRSPDPNWIISPQIASLVFNLTVVAIRYPSNPPVDVAQAINNHDKDHAMFLFEKLLVERIPQYARQIRELRTMPQGDFYTNWGI